MVFTRYLVLLLILAVAASCIPLRKNQHHVQHGRRNSARTRNQREASNYQVVESKVASDGTKHERIQEYGEDLPELPIPSDYEMNSMEEEAWSSEKVEKLPQDDSNVIFMTKDEILKLNGTRNALRDISALRARASKLAEDVDYEDFTVPKLPKAFDYTSSKETDPDLQKNEETVEEKKIDGLKPASDILTPVKELENIRKDLMEEIQEERLIEEERKIEETEEQIRQALEENMANINFKDLFNLIRDPNGIFSDHSKDDLSESAAKEVVKQAMEEKEIEEKETQVEPVIVHEEDDDAEIEAEPETKSGNKKIGLVGDIVVGENGQKFYTNVLDTPEIIFDVLPKNDDNNDEETTEVVKTLSTDEPEDEEQQGEEEEEDANDDEEEKEALEENKQVENIEKKESDDDRRRIKVVTAGRRRTNEPSAASGLSVLLTTSALIVVKFLL